MQLLGLPVKIQNDGSVKLPEDMLRYAGVTVGGTVEVFANKEGLFIKNAEVFCDVCGNNGIVELIGNRRVCPNCIDEFDKKVKEKKLKEAKL